jgi:trimeric autotransporter adhesin
MFHRRWKTVIAILLAVGALAGCGGGGGGGGSGGSGGGGGGGGGPTPPPPPPTFTVGGSISGLVGSVTLQNTGGPQLTVSADGSFTFAGTVASGSSYDVTVATQPELQACTVADGAGTATANVTNIAISCADTVLPPVLSLSVPAIKRLRFRWTPLPGIQRHKLFEDPTGEAEVFTQVGADMGPVNEAFDHIVPLHLRVDARYLLRACAETRCIDSNEVIANGPLIEAIRYFKSDQPQPGDQFGTSVALSADGQTLAIGVPFADGTNGIVQDAGAVDVYVTVSGRGWEFETRLRAPLPLTGDQFGHAVALDTTGSRLVVGAPGTNRAPSPSDPGATDAGAAYIFERSNGAWAPQPHVLENPDATQGDAFGSSVALSDEGRVAVGAPLEGAFGNAGAVYVFRRDQQLGVVSWFRETLIAPGGSSDELGSSVALSRDGATLAVGERFEDGDGTGVNPPRNQRAPNSGAVYVFTRDVVSWTEHAYIKASNTGIGDGFGEAVALSGDGLTLAVGATGEDSESTNINGAEDDDLLPQAGAVYVFVRSNDEWQQQAYVKASDTSVLAGSEGDRFGSSLALSVDGSILAVGAPFEDSALSVQTDSMAANSMATTLQRRPVRYTCSSARTMSGHNAAM